MQRDDWHPDMPMEYRNQIVTGDARELAKAIPDESIDLVFTDPIYSNIDDYRWLAETAARVLKPDRACLAWYSKPNHSEVKRALESAGLKYVYDLDYVVVAKSYRLVHFHLFCWTTHCMWLNKGHFAPDPWVPDTVISTNGTNGSHKWNKNPEALMTWLEGFTAIDSVVWDPFLGGGTTIAVCKMLGRNFIASEIDPATAEQARERVAKTQPPLPRINELVQAGMFEG
jgi:DNA modification methylase